MKIMRLMCSSAAAVGIGVLLVMWSASPAARQQTEAVSVDEDDLGGVVTGASGPEAGAVAVVQPGGSVRDDEVITAADQHGLAMLFTGMRHFRH